MSKKALPVMDRLMANHEKEESGCWNWTRSLFPNGYGCISIGGKSTGAHVASYREFNGAIPNGLMVRHSCHNKRCINPNHLSLGTGLDNADDDRRSGKLLHGSKNHRFVATQDVIAKVNELRRQGMRRKDILSAVGISSGTYARMINRGEIDEAANKAARSNNARLGCAPTQFKPGRV